MNKFPVAMGALVRSRALGLLEMEDEAGNDSKCIAISVFEVLPTYSHLNELSYVNADLLARFKYFLHYSEVEAGKIVVVKGCKNKKQAESEIKK